MDGRLYKYNLDDRAGRSALAGVDVFADPQELQRRCAATRFFRLGLDQSGHRRTWKLRLTMNRPLPVRRRRSTEAGAYTADWAVGRTCYRSRRHARNGGPAHRCVLPVVNARGRRCGGPRERTRLGEVRHSGRRALHAQLVCAAVRQITTAGYRWRLDGDLGVRLERVGSDDGSHARAVRRTTMHFVYIRAGTMARSARRS